MQSLHAYFQTVTGFWKFATTTRENSKKLTFITMKKGLGLMVAMMGLAAGTGIGSTGLSQTNGSVNFAETNFSESKTQNPDVKQTNQFANQEKTTFKRTKSSVRRFVSNDGIDPKTYGMYHVKPRTHKRTNV